MGITRVGSWVVFSKEEARTLEWIPSQPITVGSPLVSKLLDEVSLLLTDISCNVILILEDYTCPSILLFEN
jgi:hypothetical protein